MISSFFLVLKAIVLTVVIVLLMQIRVGDQTLEQKSEAWLKNSNYISYLQEAADGGMILFDQALNKLDEVLDRQKTITSEASSIISTEPETRADRLKLKRSKEFIQEKAQEAKSFVKKNVEDLQEDYLADEYGLDVVTEESEIEE